jgi:hypothetical protein
MSPGADESLGEWGKVKSAQGGQAAGTGMSGVPRERLEPFKWDESIPKLADRRSVASVTASAVG